MRSLGRELQALTDSLGGVNEAAAVAKRTAEVRALWRQAVEAVYKQAADYVLEHINEVYVVDGAKVEVKRFDRPRYGKRQGGRILVVHCDDSTIRSDLDNYQEFIKLKFQEQGEHIDAMDIVPSTGEMKNRRPFSPAVEAAESAGISGGQGAAGGSRAAQTPARPIPLTPQEQAEADAIAENVEDERTRKALLKAMVARRQLEKGEQQGF